MERPSRTKVSHLCPTRAPWPCLTYMLSRAAGTSAITFPTRKASSTCTSAAFCDPGPCQMPRGNHTHTQTVPQIPRASALEKRQQVALKAARPRTFVLRGCPYACSCQFALGYNKTTLPRSLQETIQVMGGPWEQHSRNSLRIECSHLALQNCCA